MLKIILLDLFMFFLIVCSLKKLKAFIYYALQTIHTEIFIQGLQVIMIRRFFCKNHDNVFQDLLKKKIWHIHTHTQTLFLNQTQIFFMNKNEICLKHAYCYNIILWSEWPIQKALSFTQLYKDTLLVSRFCLLTHFQISNTCTEVTCKRLWHAILYRDFNALVY